MDQRRVSKGLGWFSIGLGVTQVMAPRPLGRLIGVGEQPAVMRALGLREIATGIGILAQDRPAVGVWSRVAGDVINAALLVTAMRSRPENRARIASAAGMVLGVGVLDYLAARALRPDTEPDVWPDLAA
jgi:hypothetical protein